MPSKLYSILDLINLYNEKKEMPKYITGINKSFNNIYAWNIEHKDYLNVIDGHGIITDQEVSYNFEELIEKKYII